MTVILRCRDKIKSFLAENEDSTKRAPQKVPTRRSL
jgi:hypothetical protein